MTKLILDLYTDVDTIHVAKSSIKLKRESGIKYGKIVKIFLEKCSFIVLILILI